jgi:galactokinase
VAGRHLEPKAKAVLCQTAEHEFAGVPCGIMDQFISVMGREGHALLIDCASQDARLIPIPAQASVVVFNTNVHHALASGEYAKRRAACESAAQRLGMSQLREVSIDQLDGVLRTPSLSVEERACVRHVVSENDRTLRACGSAGPGRSGCGRTSHACITRISSR